MRLGGAGQHECGIGEGGDERRRHSIDERVDHTGQDHGRDDQRPAEVDRGERQARSRTAAACPVPQEDQRDEVVRMSEQVPIPGQFEECRDTDDSNGHDHQIAQTPCQADPKRSCEDGHAAAQFEPVPQAGTERGHDANQRHGRDDHHQQPAGRLRDSITDAPCQVAQGTQDMCAAEHHDADDVDGERLADGNSSQHDG